MANMRSCLTVALFLLLGDRVQAYLPPSTWTTKQPAPPSNFILYAEEISSSTDDSDSKFTELKRSIENGGFELLKLELDKRSGAFDIVREEKKLVETSLKKAQEEARELEVILNGIRQRHVKELRDLQDALNQQEIINELDRKDAGEQMNTLKEAHAQEIANLTRKFDVATKELKAEWSHKLYEQQTKFRNLQAQHRATLRVAEQTADRVAVLEREKRSLRTLTRNGLRLVRERVGRRLRQVRNVFSRSPTEPSPAAAGAAKQTARLSSSFGGEKLSSAVVTYEEEFEDSFQ